jgi:D-glycero-alpha-D-manno-heptose-7-phosphate kinase
VIVTRTPVRVSFLGGGTDYPEHFLKQGGQTLGITIDKYSYVSVKRMAPLFDYSIRVGYSKTELVNDREEIEHPSVRECLRFLDLHGPLEIHYIGDLPARTGLGSSSSFTVGLLSALHALKGEAPSQLQLAEEAVHVEREMIRENVGLQDQYTCALGGLLHLRFGMDGRVEPKAVDIPRARLGELSDNLLLLYTGIVRHAHEVLDEQMENTRRGSVNEDLNVLHALVDRGLALIQSDEPLVRFAELLDEAWQTKRRLSSRISNAAIDSLYLRARQNGARGGKLLGAGGGGFLLLYVEKAEKENLLRSLPDVPEIPFRFEATGTRVELSS